VIELKLYYILNTFIFYTIFKNFLLNYASLIKCPWISDFTKTFSFEVETWSFQPKKLNNSVYKKWMVTLVSFVLIFVF